MGREETGAAIYFPLRSTDTAHESGEPSAFFPPFFSQRVAEMGLRRGRKREEGGGGHARLDEGGRRRRRR